MGGLLSTEEYDYDMETSERFCENVTYKHRVLNPDNWTWCPVPESSYDAVFFAAFAIIVACVAPPKYATLVCMAAGCVFQLFANYWNLQHVSNSVALWLNMSPADVFVYAFFPPLLLDSAMRTDWFMLRKVAWNVLFLAFVMVLCGALLLIPFMLWGLGLEKDGWNAIYVALFGTMIGSTDAASCVAILKAGGAPELLSIILEGESLFNDASSLTMFEIFKNIIEGSDDSLGHDLAVIAVQTVVSFAGGVAMGLAMGIFMCVLLRWLQARKLHGVFEVAVSVGACYMVYYLTQVYVDASGVVAVAVFGLFGSATMLWGISKKVLQTGEFLAFWNSLVFIINGIIFFYVGSSSTNLVLRASEFINENPDEGPVSDLAEFFQRMAAYVTAIFFFSFATRIFFVFLCFLLFEYLHIGVKLNWREMMFVGVAGLRGSLSLILVQTIIKIAPDEVTEESFVRAEISLWTTAFVLLTLVVNAPLLGPLLSLLKLNTVSEEAQHIQNQVQRMLQQHSEAAILQARDNPDQMVEGVTWSAVQENVMHWAEHFEKHAHHSGGWRAWMQRLRQCWAAEGAAKEDSKHGVNDAGVHTGNGLAPGHMDGALGAKHESIGPDDGSSEGIKAQGTGVAASGIQLAVVDGKATGSGMPGVRGMTKVAPAPTVDRLGRADTEDDALNAWEAQVEEYMAEAQDTVFMFPAAPHSHTHPGVAGSRQDLAADVNGHAPAEGGQSTVRYMGPRLNGMPLRSPTLQRSPTYNVGAGSSAIMQVLVPAPSGRVVPAAAVAPHGGHGPSEVGPGQQSGAQEVIPRSAGEQEEEELPLPPPAALAVTAPANGAAPEPAVVVAPSPATLQAQGAAAGQTCGSGSSPQADAAFARERGGPVASSLGVQAEGPVRGSCGGPSGGDNAGHSLAAAPQLGSSGDTLVRPSRMIALRARGTLVPKAQMSAQDEGPASGGDVDNRKFVMYNVPGHGYKARALDTQQPLAHVSGSLGADAKHRQIHKLVGSGSALAQDGGEDTGSGAMEGTGHPGGGVHKVEQLLPEYRMRLVMGLRQHFRQRYHEGVITMASFNILNYACNQQLHHGSCHPVDLWSTAQSEISHHWALRAAGRLLFNICRSVMATKRRQHGKVASALLWAYRAALKLPTRILSYFLDRAMAIGLEVSMEMWQALSGSPKTLWLTHSGPAGAALLDEAKQQSDKAWGFVVDRRIEAPEKFQAIQTYRLTLALLSQQTAFIEELLEDGVVEEKEAEELNTAVLTQRQAVERQGPIHRRPRLRQVLQDSTVMRGVPPEVVRALRSQAQLKIFTNGDQIFQSVEGDPYTGGLMLVVSGIVRMVMEVDGQDVHVYLGSGAGVGLLSCLVRAYVPGIMPKACYAEGDSLGRGPVVLLMPWPVVEAAFVQSRVHHVPAYRVMDLQFMRHASALIVDAMRGSAVASLELHMQRLLIHIFDDYHCATAATAGAAAGGSDTAGRAAVSYVLPRLTSLLEVLNIPGVQAVAEQLLSLAPELAVSVVDDQEFVPPELMDLKELVAHQITVTSHAIHDRLNKLVGEGQLLMLGPGEPYAQACTAVLVQGSLVPKEAAGGVSSAVGGLSKVIDREDRQGEEGGYAADKGQDAAAQDAPSLMLWSPDFIPYVVSGELANPAILVAGPEGAQLVVLGPQAGALQSL